MWEVDPETKSKLLALQKQAPNAICADCSSPSPQWASPKFGTFICLDCAGAHRGMGVHISFVRSVMMDSFKVSEVKRMELGGNAAWREFWDTHPEGGAGEGEGGKEWKGVAKERYEGSVGEEWKERLSCRVEGREFAPLPKKERKPAPAAAGSGANTPVGAGGTGSPAAAAARTASPALSGMRKERNEAYFAKMGAQNASRSEDVPPSQGGKYSGFGSGFVPEGPGKGSGEQGIPGVDEFQKDPVAALSRGFGWFTTTVGKSAKNVNEGWIQPNVQKFAESDFAAQARGTAASVAQNVQKGTKTAADSFNTSFQKFVEGSEGGNTKSPTVEPERKDFWDSFGGNASGPAGSSMLAGATTPSGKKGSSIGTSAMKSGSKGEEGKEGWDENW